MTLGNDFDHGLSEKELLTIAKIIAFYDKKIDKVGIFGSRASGDYKDYSDIDIVLYGSLNAPEMARLGTLFDESSLGLRVDLKNYNEIEHLPLLRHIDACVKIILTKEQLKNLVSQSVEINDRI